MTALSPLEKLALQSLDVCSFLDCKKQKQKQKHFIIPFYKSFLSSFCFFRIDLVILKFSSRSLTYIRHNRIVLDKAYDVYEKQFTDVLFVVSDWGRDSCRWGRSIGHL